MGEWLDVLKVFGGALGAIVMYLAGSKLFEAIAPKLLERRFQKQDQLKEIHQTNQALELDLDKTAFQTISDRLTKLEDKFEKLQEKHNSLMVENAETKKDNEHLKENNDRQQQEIAELRNDRKILQDRVNSLTHLVAQLKTEIEALKQALEIAKAAKE